MEKHQPIVEDFIDKYCQDCSLYEKCGERGEKGEEILGLDTVVGRDMLKLCILTKILENTEK